MGYQIVAIEREYATGGQDIGARVGEMLGIPCYGRDILQMAAREWNTEAAYIEHLEENFTMFASTGTPVRARVKVSLKGCFQEDLQSRALHSPDRTKIRMVQQKDTLWAISAREYGDPAQWRQIALANGIRNPRKLQQVSQLVIPPLPKEGSSDGPI